jgi:oxygen-independent coproporphyrinogen-3 oxidase
MYSLDTDLIELLAQKYSRPGPRYTSYPPANRFHDRNNDALINHLGSDEGALSLYFHIPFCETLCWYCGCHTVITRNSDRADHYLDLLEREMALYKKHLEGVRLVSQIHLGGGTPNFLTPSQIKRIHAIIQEHFEISPDAEISTELDPRRLSLEQVEAFQAAGFNRGSFGVQDFNPKVQKAIHRIQTQEQNQQAIQWLRDAMFKSVNIDLIYGLPYQTKESYKETIDQAVALEPDRITLFSYAHVPWMKPAQKQLGKHELPDAKTKIALFLQAISQLHAHGYVYIGMDHFARADDELVKAREQGSLQRNFQGYSTQSGTEILGFGISSISQNQHSYRQNVKDIPSYEASLSRQEFPIERGYLLSDQDQLRRKIIMTLMCNMHLDFEQFNQDYGIQFAHDFSRELERLRYFEKDALLEITDKAIAVTPLGRFFIRNIAMTFDTFLKQDEQRYSKTI